MQQIVFQAMHCRMLVAVDGESPRITRRLEQVPGWFESWEQRLSRFRPDSELSQLNQRSGEVVQVSALMQEVLAAALRADRASEGLVTPAVLDALEKSGYDRSFAQMSSGEQFCVDQLQSSSPVVAQALQLKARARTVYLAPGARLDLGGIAKGWLVDRAAQRLRRLGPALVDAGGDIAVSGPLLSGEAWSIGLADPFNPERDIDMLMIYRGGVATSGRDYRRWQKNGVWQHHIIDPRTGEPARTDVLTATVIAPTAQEAEMAAKVVLILGSLQGIEWLEKRPHLAGLIVLEDGQTLHSRRWMNYIWR
jgi:thiamine biosynthesis lipoprotein